MTSLVASDSDTVGRPSPLMDGSYEAPLACLPWLVTDARDVRRLADVVGRRPAGGQRHQRGHTEAQVAHEDADSPLTSPATRVGQPPSIRDIPVVVWPTPGPL